MWIWIFVMCLCDPWMVFQDLRGDMIQSVNGGEDSQRDSCSGYFILYYLNWVWILFSWYLGGFLLGFHLGCSRGRYLFQCSVRCFIMRLYIVLRLWFFFFSVVAV